MTTAAAAPLPAPVPTIILRMVLLPYLAGEDLRVLRTVNRIWWRLVDTDRTRARPRGDPTVDGLRPFARQQRALRALRVLHTWVRPAADTRLSTPLCIPATWSGTLKEATGVDYTYTRYLTVDSCGRVALAIDDAPNRSHRRVRLSLLQWDRIGRRLVPLVVTGGGGGGCGGAGSVVRCDRALFRWPYWVTLERVEGPGEGEGERKRRWTEEEGEAEAQKRVRVGIRTPDRLVAEWILPPLVDVAATESGLVVHHLDPGAMGGGCGGGGGGGGAGITVALYPWPSKRDDDTPPPPLPTPKLIAHCIAAPHGLGMDLLRGAFWVGGSVYDRTDSTPLLVATAPGGTRVQLFSSQGSRVCSVVPARVEAHLRAAVAAAAAAGERWRPLSAWRCTGDVLLVACGDTNVTAFCLRMGVLLWSRQWAGALDPREEPGGSLLAVLPTSPGAVAVAEKEVWLVESCNAYGTKKAVRRLCLRTGKDLRPPLLTYDSSDRLDGFRRLGEWLVGSYDEHLRLFREPATGVELEVVELLYSSPPPPPRPAGETAEYTSVSHLEAGAGCWVAMTASDCRLCVYDFTTI